MIKKREIILKSVKPFGNVKNPEAVIFLPYLEGAD